MEQIAKQFFHSAKSLRFGVKGSKSPAERETLTQSMRPKPNEVRRGAAEISFRLVFSPRRNPSSSRAQYSVVYMLAISGILIFLMGAVFIMTSSFQRATTENFGREILGSVTAKIETSLIEFKELSKNANTSSANINIPELIGEQRYQVTANQHMIEIRTFGNPSLVQQYNVTFWDADLGGSVFSSKGKIHVTYSAANNKVMFE
ncbi:MAG: hypothetical protein V1839_01175 [archaeon]